ncbi:pentapeptide repeat-containing protein [Stigmatella ashevillensis]|uniref:pentapeptide repeat-containing protein n=1 Tax=Stigmatella ashevillensis TaxID=2995309 RepID=UPI00358DC9C9
MPVRSVKWTFDSRATPPSCAKSRAPGADIRKYSPLRPCTTSGVDASGVDASGVDASGVDASGVDASGVDASGVDASGVDASGVDASGVDASGVDSSGSDEQPIKGWISTEESKSRVRVCDLNAGRDMASLLDRS